MRTPSSRRLTSVQHSPVRGNPIQTDLDRDFNQSNSQTPLAPGTIAKTPADAVAPEANVEKLTLAERLDRISKYRIRSASIKSTAKPSGIRRGGNAEVVRANFKRNKGTRGKRVAVKKLLWSDTADKEKKFVKNFIHEVELLVKLSHKNIVQLVGFVEDLKHEKAWIILSWEPHGTVREFLASGKWEIPERISLIQDMFEGLQYLHTREPPVCHGDLKSDNILVSSSYHAVITDFGSARLMGNNKERKWTQDIVREANRVPATEPTSSLTEATITVSDGLLTFTGPEWTLRWAAPELLIKDESPSQASDVWSAGWVCWEMMTGRIPFDEDNLERVIVVNVIHTKLPLIHQDAQLAQLMALCSLMGDCWRLEPQNRPRVTQCCAEVEWMPSVPPLRAKAISPVAKKPSTRLLLEMGYLHYSQDRPETAASLLEQVLVSAESVANQEMAEARTLLGDVYRVQCKYTEAEESYTQARDTYALFGNDEGQAKAVKGLGDVYCVQCKYNEAEQFFVQAQEIYARISDNQGLATAVLGLGDVYRSQCKYNKAEESYTRAKEIYAHIGDKHGQANAVKGLGYVYYSRCQDDGAEEFFNQSQEIYARIGDAQGRADTLGGLGDIYRARCQYTEAEESYTQAQEIYASIGDVHSRANTLLGLGHVYRAQCKYNEAEKAYTEAQEIYARLGDEHSQADVEKGLGYVYHARCQDDEAEKSFKFAQEIYNRIDNIQGRADTLGGLGDIRLVQCKYKEAEEFYAQAKEICACIGDHQGGANMVLGLGDVYYAQCKYNEAEESYTQAQEIYDRMGDVHGGANAVLGLGDVYRAECKYNKAEESYTLAKSIYARLGDDQGRAHTIKGLGDIYRAQLKNNEAEELFLRAQDIYSRIGDDRGRAITILGLGDVHRAQCKYKEAEEDYKLAQEIYVRIGDILGEANILFSLGHLHQAQARGMEAVPFSVPFYAKARDLYLQIGDLNSEKMLLAG